MPPCLTLSIIRYGSRVKWSNPGKGVAPSLTPWCSSYRKGSLRVTLDYGHQLIIFLRNGIFFCLEWRLVEMYLQSSRFVSLMSSFLILSFFFEWQQMGIGMCWGQLQILAYSCADSIPPILLSLWRFDERPNLGLLSEQNFENQFRN